MQNKNNYLLGIAVIIIVVIVAYSYYWFALPKSGPAQIRGNIEEVMISVFPPQVVEDCRPVAYAINYRDIRYYLVDMCPFLESYGEDILVKEVIVSGLIEERQWDAPTRKEINAPTIIETYYLLHVESIQIVG